MQRAIPTTRPFSFDHTLQFVRRFLPIRHDYLLGDRSLTAAVAIGGRARPFTMVEADGQLTLDARGHASSLARIASDFVGANDDVAGFYEAAKGDRVMERLIESLYGLHHVRFLTLEEVAVYSVMMQRAPVAVAATLRRRFLERFGLAVDVGATRLRAFPRFDTLTAIDGDAIAEAIGNRRKGAQIATVVRGVAAIGEATLREAPYAEARDALLEVPGIGPFSAAAILLRGLGRMDELPFGTFDDTARELYGDRFDEQAIRRRYGNHVGYWSFYLKTGVARLRDEQVTTLDIASARAPSKTRDMRAREITTLRSRKRRAVPRSVA